MAARYALSLSVVIIALVAFPLATQAMPLEPKLQAALLTKIISYDSTLAASQPSPIRVLVVYQNANAKVKAVLDAFREVGLDAYAVSESDAEAEIAGARILYLMPDVNAAPFAELSIRVGTLSVSGAAGFAESGQCAIGLGLNDDGRPQIVVNLAQMQLEGHRLAPQFLALTRIVR